MSPIMAALKAIRGAKDFQPPRVQLHHIFVETRRRGATGVSISGPLSKQAEIVAALREKTGVPLEQRHKSPDDATVHAAECTEQQYDMLKSAAPAAASARRNRDGQPRAAQ